MRLIRGASLAETRSKAATKAANGGKTKTKGEYMRSISTTYVDRLLGTRSPSAYNLWMKENLKKYKEEHPDVLQKDIMKAVCTLTFFHCHCLTHPFPCRSVRFGRTRRRTRDVVKTPSRRRRRPPRPRLASSVTRPQRANLSPLATTRLAHLPSLSAHICVTFLLTTLPHVASLCSLCIAV